MKSLTLVASAVGLAISISAPVSQAKVQQNEIEVISILAKKNLEGAEIAGINVKELPINVHVVGLAEIERIRFVDPNEFLDRIPGETQVRNLRIPDGGKGYTIPLVDGLPLENPYEGATQRLDRVNTFDIAQVQVIKGPTSALYGNNAFGGVVNVITKDAPKQTQGQILIEAGNFDRSRLGVSLGGTASEVGFFFDANTRHLDGLRADSKNDKDQFSAKLIFSVNDELKVTARAEYLDEAVVARGDLTAEQITQDKRQAGSLSSSTDLQQSTFALKLEQYVEAGLIEFSLLQREKDTIGLSRFRGPQDEYDVGQSLKFTYRHDLDFGHLISGYELYDSEQETKRYARSDLELQGAYTEFKNELTIDAYFLQYHAEVFEALTLTAGARYEDIELTSSLFNEQAQFSDLSTKVGVSYQLSKEHLIWASMSEGFYAPDLGDLYDFEEGNPNLDPEEMKNLEFGIRGYFGAWHYDSSVYHSEIKNYLVTQEFTRLNDSGLEEEYEQVTNAGQVSLKGVESVIEYIPQQTNWRFGITHTFNRNTYDSFVQSTPGASDDYSGKVMRRAPKHHVNARLAWLGKEDFTVELEADVYSHYYADHQNSEQSKFTRDPRINLRLDYQFKQWKFYLHALNLTDTLEDRATYSRDKMKFRTIDGKTLYLGATYQF